MTVTSPYELAADALKTLIDAEYAPEGWTAVHDLLHDSLGEDGTLIGISPDREGPLANNAVVQEVLITVKFLGQYELDVDPEQSVDPRIVTRFAERFRRAVQAASYSTGALLWYFDITGIEYPSDPSGSKTRFVAGIRAFSQNSGLVETVG